MTTTCPMCGRRDWPGGPAIPDDPAEIRSQIESLGERLEELKRGSRTPRVLYENFPEMCPMCQALMGGEDGPPGRELLMDRLHEQIATLEGRAAARGKVKGYPEGRATR